MKPNLWNKLAHRNYICECINVPYDFFGRKVKKFRIPHRSWGTIALTQQIFLKIKICILKLNLFKNVIYTLCTEKNNIHENKFPQLSEEIRVTEHFYFLYYMLMWNIYILIIFKIKNNALNIIMHFKNYPLKSRIILYKLSFNSFSVSHSSFHDATYNRLF